LLREYAKESADAIGISATGRGSRVARAASSKTNAGWKTQRRNFGGALKIGCKKKMAQEALKALK